MKRLAIVISAVLLTTLIVAGTFGLRMRDERARTAQLQARVAELEAAPRPSPALPVAPPAPPPQPAPVSVPAAKPKAPAPAVVAPVAKTPEKLANIDQVKQMMTGSAGRDLARMMLLQQYPDLGKELGLSEAQTNNLLDLLTRQQMDLSTDSINLLGGETDPARMQAIERTIEEKGRTHEAELSALLGNKYADWQQYQATAAARQEVSRLQSALGSTNPLSAEQSKSLLVSFTAVRSQMNSEGQNEAPPKGGNSKEVLENQFKQVEETNRRLLDAASPQLTIAQRDSYKQLLDQSLAMLRTIMNPLAVPSGQSGTSH